MVRGGRVIAVVARHTNLAAARTPSRLELTYLQCADDLARMIAAGDFPVAGAPTGPRRGAPRVGDGLVRLDVEGRITYASPNALSALHRLGYVGDVVDRSLAEITTPLLDASGPVDESLPLVLSGRAPVAQRDRGPGHDAVAARDPADRGRRADRRAGAAARRLASCAAGERELLTKDATIREVHHRVKNNLQTVAALLRLQARRIASTRGGSRCSEAMRRVRRSPWCTRRCPKGWARRSTSTRWSGARSRWPSSSPRRAGRCRCARRAPSARCAPRTPPRWRWSSPSWSRTRWSTACAAAGRRGRRPAPSATAGHLRGPGPDDGVGLPEGFVPGPGRPRHPDRAGAGRRGDAGAHHLGRRRRRAAPGSPSR